MKAKLTLGYFRYYQDDGLLVGIKLETLYIPISTPLANTSSSLRI